MARLSISALTTFRWSLAQDLEAYSELGFSTFGAWRRKLIDEGSEARELVRRSGLSASSLSWAGGFTGGDGASFEESIRDAVAAIEQAAEIRAPYLIVFPGPQAGHTRKHALRLFQHALDRLLPVAAEYDVAMAIQPRRRGTHQQCSFLTDLGSTFHLIRDYDDPWLKLAFDAYEFAWEASNVDLVIDHVEDLAVVALADGARPPVHEQHRLPLGEGRLPIADLVERLVAAGYDGCFELDLVGALFDRPCYRDLIQASTEYWSEAVGSVVAVRA